jgi:hypothetical protein
VNTDEQRVLESGADSGDSGVGEKEDVFVSEVLSEMVMISWAIFATVSRQSAIRIWAWSETDSPGVEGVQRSLRATARRASRTSLVLQWYVLAKLLMGKVSWITPAISAKKASVNGHWARVEVAGSEGLLAESVFCFLCCGSLEGVGSTDPDRLLVREEEVSDVWFVTGFIVDRVSVAGSSEIYADRDQKTGSGIYDSLVQR